MISVMILMIDDVWFDSLIVLRDPIEQMKKPKYHLVLYQNIASIREN